MSSPVEIELPDLYAVGQMIKDYARQQGLSPDRIVEIFHEGVRALADASAAYECQATQSAPKQSAK